VLLNDFAHGVRLLIKSVSVMTIKEFRNKKGNLLAKIKKAHGKFRVVITQFSNSGVEIVEDYYQSKDSISTYNRAEKWALKQLELI